MDQFFVRFLTLLLFVGISASLVGCQKDQSHQLVGKWVGFPLSTSQSSGYFSAAEMAETKATIEFTNDGRFKMTLAGPSQSEDVVQGSWVWTDRDSGTETAAILKTDDSQTIRWQIQFEPDSTRFTARQIDGDSRIGDVLYEKQ